MASATLTPEEAVATGFDSLRKGDLAAAERLFRAVLDGIPDQGRALHGLALVALQTNHHDDAVDLLERARRTAEDGPELLCNLAGAYLGADRPREALGCLRRALEARPDLFLGHSNLAAVYIELRRYGEAEKSALRAIALQPSHLGSRHNLARAYEADGRFAAAAEAYEAMLQVAPGSEIALVGKANALIQLGRADGCIATLAPLIEGKASDTARSTYLLALSYSSRVSALKILREHVRLGRMLELPAIAPRPRTPSRERRLRLGYLSPDLRAHSVAFFVAPVLERHDRKRFEVFCYYSNTFADEVTERLRALAEHWIEAGRMADDALAQRIADDGIDVLVDLAGHTAGGRPGVLARRAAPIQVAWLGYPTSTGVPGMSARLSDTHVDPPGHERYATEQVWRLPRSYFCYGPPRDAPEPAPPPVARRGSITFGSFNSLAKLSDDTVSLWLKVLRAVEGSRLFLKARQLGEPRAAQGVRERFVAKGIDPQRLVLRGWSPNERDHLAAYREIDIALDTFPYNGATTTCEALWMGVPVVSLAGERHASRMGLSILSAAGHGEWCATDAARFCDVAQSLASDVAALAELRAGMRDQLRASALLDAAGFTAALESLLETQLGVAGS